MHRSRRSTWDARYRSGNHGSVEPARVLEENAHLLPMTGEALELACGLAANGRLLARLGLRVTAWDYAAAAVEAARQQAAAENLTMECSVRDVVSDPPPPAHFDVIVVSRFLERALAPALEAALRPAGLLYYQTYTRGARRGPRNPAFLLGPGELWRLFPTLEPLVYREERAVGDPTQGWREEAMLVALKPRPDAPNEQGE